MEKLGRITSASATQVNAALQECVGDNTDNDRKSENEIGNSGIRNSDKNRNRK